MPRSTCRILRHKPNVIGIELDAEGWVNIEDLLARPIFP
ncbi:MULTISPECIES: RNA 2'-phosphotransferase [Agrobacterium]